MRVCLCLSLYVQVYKYVCYCACETQGLTFSIILNHSLSIQKKSLTEPGVLLIGWTCWPEISRDLPISDPAPGLALQMCAAMRAFLHGCWRSKLSSLCLNCKHFTPWAISQPLLVHSLLISRVLEFNQFTDIWQSYRRGEGEHKSGRQEENSCVEMTIKNENQQAQGIQNAHFKGKRTSMGKVGHKWEKLSGEGLEEWMSYWFRNTGFGWHEIHGSWNQAVVCLRIGRWDWALVPGRLLSGSFYHLLAIWLGGYLTALYLEVQYTSCYVNYLVPTLL